MNNIDPVICIEIYNWNLQNQIHLADHTMFTDSSVFVAL